MTKEFPRLFLLSAALVMLCTTGLCAAEILTGQPLVVIDPGHDRRDPGLVSETGLRESAVTLTLARKVSDLLSAPCRVRLTRTDQAPALPVERTAMANQTEADLYLSLHLQGDRTAAPRLFYFSLPEQTDADTWQTRALKSQAGSKSIAEALSASLTADRPGPRPVVHSGPVLPLEGLNMPGVLVEAFALSQVPDVPEDQDTYIQGQALGIARGVLGFLGHTLPDS